MCFNSSFKYSRNQSVCSGVKPILLSNQSGMLKIQSLPIVVSVVFLLASVFLLVSYLKSGIFGASDKGLAYAAPGEDPREITRDEILAGLWREGQAVFSDVPALDLFIKDRYARGYKPEQPINYSHVIHVNDNGIECQYCHSGVGKSAYATIPPVELCMGCHNVIKADSPEIQKLKEHWEKKIPIEWIPVHNLPEHAKFNHQRHVKAGIGCQNCHGQVQDMDVVERVSTLKMGFCVSCHRDQGASIDCGICHY